MKKSIVVLLIIINFSCNTLKNHFDVEGIYNYKEVNYSCKLIVKKDKTFILKEYYFNDGSSGCEGEIKFKSQDTLFLICNDEKFPSQISSGYMSERVQELIIVNSRDLKFGNVILIKE